MRTRRFRDALVDPLIALLLACTYVYLLLHSVSNLGYARDEGFYFHAATDYRKWFDILFTHPLQAIDQGNVDRFWRDNHEHPGFVKSLFALSIKYLQPNVRALNEPGTAFRFPGMVLAALGVSTTYLWGRRAIGRLPGFIAAVLLAMQPAMFYHSHLACFDVAIMTMLLVTTYAYWRSIDGGGLAWALIAGLLYGLALDTKHNAWLLPPALVVHFLITRGYGRLRRDLRAGRLRLPLALLTMATIGPVVFFVCWPWIWFDTGHRIAEWVAFHMGHEYYNMEFLGVTYFRPPMPRLYAWVMTIATVPTITLVLFGLGLWKSTSESPFVRRVRSTVTRWLADKPIPGRLKTEQAAELAERERRFATRFLWLVCLGTSYAPWFSSDTPIFGGTKHWITAYPYLCLFAGVGFEWARVGLTSGIPERLRRLRIADLALVASVITGPIVMTLHAHPWGLSAYTPIVGGTPGGATLGLNRSFWGYTTGAVLGFINAHAPASSAVYVHDTAMDSWYRMQKDGRVRADLQGSLTLSSTDWAVYHHEQHMARVEYQLWVDYGTVQPVTVGMNDGVPIVWVYARPGHVK